MHKITNILIKINNILIEISNILLKITNMFPKSRTFCSIWQTFCSRYETFHLILDISLKITNISLKISNIGSKSPTFWSKIIINYKIKQKCFFFYDCRDAPPHIGEMPPPPHQDWDFFTPLFFLIPPLFADTPITFPADQCMYICLSSGSNI